jgi:hypothetical protein
MDASTDFSIDDLSEKLAILITDHLEARLIPKPLVVIDLFYHYADWYLPLVSYLTIDGLENALASGGFELFQQKEGPIHLDPKPLEEQMDQLMQLEWNQEDLPDIGRGMIRKTATVLNQTKLWGRVTTHSLFGAYAADGTVEGHSSEDWNDILTACGLSEEQRVAWKRHGFY